MRPGVLALLVVVLAAPPVRAQQPPPRLGLHLEYSRGPRTICPDEHAAAELLRGVVDYAEREDAELRVVVKTSRVGRQHRVRVVLRDKTDRELWSREHEDPDCTDALLSCVVSTRLGLVNLKLPVPAPVAVEPAPPPAPPPVAPIVVALPEPVVPPPPAAPVAAPRAFDVLMGADLVFGVGNTPGPNLGAGAFVAARLVSQPALSFELTGRVSRSLGAVQVGYVRVRSTFLGGQLALCGRMKFVSFCPLIGVGALAHNAVRAGTIAIVTPSPFAILGVRLRAEHRFAEILVRGFLEFEGMAGGGSLAFYSAPNEQWRPALGGTVGLGFALEP